jgi:DNA (cytosine-5)-methyltransferase 1
VGDTEELPTVISFCSGYGGIERGLDLAGVEHRVLAYVEIEAFAIANLVAKMEAGELDPAPIYTNLKTFPAQLFRDSVDLITGGYPCQPFSAAGKRLGADDPRHLWPHIARAIDIIRPGRVFFENVEGHISLGLREVLSDLEERGYRQAWGVFSAAEVGAPHQRKRVFIMGESAGEGLAFSNGPGTPTERQPPTELECPSGLSDELADTVSEGSQGRLSGWEDTERQGELRHSGRCSTAQGTAQGDSWPPEPNVGRVVDGCPDRVDRIRLLGNGVVPQTAARAWELLEKELGEK